MKINKLKKNFDKAVMDIVKALEKKQDLYFDYAVCDDLSSVLCFSNEYFFNLQDICKDIFEKQQKGLITQWQDDCLENQDQNINYNSYTMGLRFNKNILAIKLLK